MSYKIKSGIIAFAITASLSVAPVAALDWRFGVGGHDYYVDQADSHTLGAGVKIALSHLTESEIKLTGELNVFVDNDVDELDPDHIPVWFSSYYSAGGDLVSFSEYSSLFWDVSLSGKRNTVSSVEKQVQLFPALGYAYQRASFNADLKLGGGYYFLEIDDDVPRMRGYDRDDFQNKTGAYTLAVGVGFDMAERFDLTLAVQQWHDGSDWLENQLQANLSYDADHWSEKSKLIFSVKYNEYNLDPYAKVPTNDPDYLPILPWNKDLLVRLYFDMPWG